MLIANRGEIAVRVARTLRRLGVESVAVYSDADAAAPHVRAADRAEHIGPTPAAQSYLDVERVIGAARRSGAEAIHPGYGFLSESPALVEACEEAGIVFVGPGAAAMALLGDKVAAKAAAEAAGVPILPGLSGEALSDEEILAWAEAGGEFPLLVKAAAGGGGKGMRMVAKLSELAEAIGGARREAKGAFGDDRLFVERYVEASRHIEVQVLADSHGNAVHLGERECSLQRRHQKVIEESPSPVVGPELRERMGAAAAALARAAGYVNAGTVELIAEREHPERFYFLEVNTRLQVEHPVTEAVTGVDLVELQLRVAAGEELPFSQDEVRLDGHAVEARLYAEDPAHGFLPSAGRIVAYREPAGIRVDSGIEEGTEVGTDYDPMLAKLIAHAPDRSTALARLRDGLGQLVALGPATNAAYLGALLARPEVESGEIDTGLIERLGEQIAPPAPHPALPALALALLLGPPPSDDPWDARDAWRQQGPAWARARLETSAGDAAAIDVAIRPTTPPAWQSFVALSATKDCHGAWEWELGGESGAFSWDGRSLAADDEAHTVEVFWEAGEPLRAPAREGLPGARPGAVWLRDGGAEPAWFALAETADAAAGAAGGGSLEAPMPGVVIDVRAEAGAAVAEGDVLVVLESMKMELQVQSPRDGTVAEVAVAAGDQIARGQVLVALASEEEEG
ncbi:MAG TPA: biotin carboxylase N-terminal domain-containing protein [Solirubrobacterales bacterium]|nr:biotin carboxylase N-terminal domain-containing protein [Solirubrobacterales bacterium]